MKVVFCCALLCLSVVFAKATIDVSLQMQLGNPSGATADTNNHDHYLIQRSVEALDYSDNLGEPVWASWDLTAADIGTNSRSSFSTDTNLPPNFNWVTTDDYTHSGYDRGHLCPSKDRTESATNNDLVFFMSNIMPQASVNNSGVWNAFEGYCRSLVQSSNNYELLIICGPSGFSGARINTNGPVFIPDYVWKIVVVVPPGAGTAASRITETNRVIALKIPNDDNVTNDWSLYVTSANQIQVDTGFTFFTALSPEIADALRNKVDGQTNPPPVIFSFSPTNGMPVTNVVITGTNFNFASAVTFNGASASYLVDSDSQITAYVPTNAGSGFISVTTPSGTAISTNLFTVMSSGGGAVYSGILAGWDVSSQTNYGLSPLPPTTNAPNLSVIGLTRGSGVKTSGTASAGGWGGVAFTNVSPTNAINSNQFATFSLTASNGYKMSFSSITRFDYRRSGTGPTNGVLQFQVGNGAFTDITNLIYSSAGGGATNNPIDLSGFAALQDIGANTNVTFRIVNYNGGSLGTWYIYDVIGGSALDLALRGTVTQVLETTLPTVTPNFQSINFVAGQISLVVTGATTASFTVTATTNLTNPQWETLLTTNSVASPFTFTDTNGLPQRFYRLQSP